MTRLTKVTVVLGAGRSMTSGVAKGLHLAGFEMGTEMVDASPSNPQGHYEDRQLVNLNDRMLDAMGRTWFDPPPTDIDWRPVVAQWTPLASRYLDKRFHSSGQFGIKDPRLTVLWPVWSEALGGMLDRIDPILVMVHRDPHRAAASLAARDAIPTLGALQLTRAYQQRAAMILAGDWCPLPATT